MRSELRSTGSPPKVARGEGEGGVVDDGEGGVCGEDEGVGDAGVVGFAEGDLVGEVGEELKFGGGSGLEDERVATEFELSKPGVGGAGEGVEGSLGGAGGDSEGAAVDG